MLNNYIAIGYGLEFSHEDCYSKPYYNDLVFVISANTEAEALGLALEQYPDTNNDGWEIKLIEACGHVTMQDARYLL